ncbi:MAG: helix-turn-helix domain-containing protein, partial [Aeromicrobium sp.]
MTETPSVPSRSVGRPRRTGVAGADPRREILLAASRLFTEHGYAATTMTQVAREVGLGQSSMYYWFRSKDDLLKALVSANRES